MPAGNLAELQLRPVPKVGGVLIAVSRHPSGRTPGSARRTLPEGRRQVFIGPGGAMSGRRPVVGKSKKGRPTAARLLAARCARAGATVGVGRLPPWKASCGPSKGQRGARRRQRSYFPAIALPNASLTRELTSGDEEMSIATPATSKVQRRL